MGKSKNIIGHEEKMAEKLAKSLKENAKNCDCYDCSHIGHKNCGCCQ
jgi:hypothetical protein